MFSCQILSQLLKYIGKFKWERWNFILIVSFLNWKIWEPHVWFIFWKMWSSNPVNTMQGGWSLLVPMCSFPVCLISNQSMFLMGPTLSNLSTLTVMTPAPHISEPDVHPGFSTPSPSPASPAHRCSVTPTAEVQVPQRDAWRRSTIKSQLFPRGSTFCCISLSNTVSQAVPCALCCFPAALVPEGPVVLSDPGRPPGPAPHAQWVKLCPIPAQGSYHQLEATTSEYLWTLPARRHPSTSV